MSKNQILDEKTFTSVQKDVSWGDFCALPMPNKLMENWRFAKVANVSFDGFALPEEVSKETAKELITRSDKIAEASGTFIFADGKLISGTLSEEAKKAGVECAPLVQKFGDKILPRLSTPSDKIATLHKAYASPHILYIPTGVKLEKPFAIYNWSVAKDSATFPFVIVLAEENSSAKLVEGYFSRDEDTRALVVSRVEIFAEKNAQVSYETMQVLNAKTHFYSSQITHLAENASVQETAVNIGGERARTVSELSLEGERSTAEVFSLSVGNSEQEFDQRTIQKHIAPEASSSLLFKNTLLGKARTIFSGNIVVQEGAQKTNAEQSNRNLLLSPDAEAHSLPGLEIDANDVRCSHGATNGALDPEQLFYLGQRGIPLEEAKALLISGFVEEVISRIGDTALADYARELVAEKVRRS